MGRECKRTISGEGERKEMKRYSRREKKQRHKERMDKI
jgi:hypothetical protein